MQDILFPRNRMLLVTTDYPPDVGGVAWYYKNLVKKFNDRHPHQNLPPSRRRTNVVSPLAGGSERGVERKRVEVLKLEKWTMTSWWPLILIPLLLKTRKLKTDVWWVGQILPVGTVVWALSYLWRKPYIVSTHGMDVLIPLKSRRKRWLVKKILEGAEMITVNSEWTKEQIVANYESRVTNHELRNKIAVIYPVPKPKRDVPQTEVNALRMKLGIPEEARVLLTVARLVRRKGIDHVITALPEVWRELPELHYVIVGEGEERKKLEETVGARLIAPLHFVGAVSDEELAAYYKMADAFILLPCDIDGDTEGFGIVYLEANQYGIPIIAAASGGTAEALLRCQRVTMMKDPENVLETAGAILNSLK